MVKQIKNLDRLSLFGQIQIMLPLGMTQGPNRFMISWKDRPKLIYFILDNKSDLLFAHLLPVSLHIYIS